jgi:hypothetical protein
MLATELVFLVRGGGSYCRKISVASIPNSTSTSLVSMSRVLSQVSETFRAFRNFYAITAFISRSTGGLKTYATTFLNRVSY